jgi:hypothetical protein
MVVPLMSSQRRLTFLNLLGGLKIFELGNCLPHSTHEDPLFEYLCYTIYPIVALAGSQFYRGIGPMVGPQLGGQGELAHTLVLTVKTQKLEMVYFWKFDTKFGSKSIKLV